MQLIRFLKGEKPCYGEVVEGRLHELTPPGEERLEGSFRRTAEVFEQ